MTVGKTDEIKQELARKVESTKAGTKLKKSMSIADMIKVMEPQIKKALPEVITPERFTRMALSALNTTPKLNECTPMSFLRLMPEYQPTKTIRQIHLITNVLTLQVILPDTKDGNL